MRDSLCQCVTPTRRSRVLLKMLQKEWTLRGRDDQLIKNSLRILADQSFDAYEHPLEVLARHPDTRSCVVDYGIWCEGLRSRCAASTRSWGLSSDPRSQRQSTPRRGKAMSRPTDTASKNSALIHTRSTLSPPPFERFNWETEGDDAVVN